MWKRFFGPNAMLVGLDINPACRSFQEDQIAIRIGSQSDGSFLAAVLGEFGVPDIVIDDGSHVMPDVSASFDFLYPRTAAGGVYLVEDLHTAYWEEFEGGLRRWGSFIERCKGLIDELHAEFTRGALDATEFSLSTMSMHVYPSVVVFERGRTSRKSDLRV